MKLRTIGVFAALAIFALSQADPARALPVTGDFNIAFDESGDGTVDWFGMFSTDGAGTLTSFTAQIGGCIDPAFAACTYDLFLEGPPSWDGVSFSGPGADVFTIAPSILRLTPLFTGGLFNWVTTGNGFDREGFFQRDGTWFVTVKPTEVPEPSSYLLLMVGLGALAGFSLRRRSQQA